MRLERIRYRSRQFWQALNSVVDPDDLTLAQAQLSSVQMELFSRLQSSEQAHSLQVFKRLLNQCRLEPVEYQEELLLAALLHDVGKSCFPLSVWERVLIVLAKTVFPQHVHEWGALPAAGSPRGWRRPFIIAEQHPVWGAELAAAARASPLAVSLIRRHQEPSRPGAKTLEDQLLSRLQAADGSF